jgi:hypothetical protein
MRDTRTANWDVYLRGGAVVLAAFVVTGLIFMAGYRAVNTARDRVTGIYSRGSGTDLRPAPLPNTRVAANPYSPGSPFGAGAPPSATGFGARTLPTTIPVSVPPPPPLPANANSAFPTVERRQEAQAAIAPLRDTISTVRQYDSKALWAEIPAAPAPGANGGMSSSTGVASQMITPSNRNAQSPIDPAVARQDAMEKIINQADALAAEITLVTHPDRFPEVLRDGVGEFRREIRIYLSTVQYAAIHPEERDTLRPLAQKHLARSEAILNELENATGGRVISGFGGN